MNLFQRPDPGQMSALPPVTPRQETDTALPTGQEVIKKDEVASVQYGTGKKKDTPGSGRKVGTNALKIKLNESSPTGSKTGGLNV